MIIETITAIAWLPKKCIIVVPTSEPIDVLVIMQILAYISESHGSFRDCWCEGKKIWQIGTVGQFGIEDSGASWHIYNYDVATRKTEELPFGSTFEDL